MEGYQIFLTKIGERIKIIATALLEFLPGWSMG
jgi:hypothetical protein